MLRPEDITFSVPRFLSFIDLAYLLEAAKAADDHLASKLPTTPNAENGNSTGNINATRQSLLRAVFIASYAILEQNLDELVNMERAKNSISLSPSELKDRGIVRSLTYANKILGKRIDKNLPHWKDLLSLQDVRNHLVHYGPDFDNSENHNDRFEKFTKSDYVTLRPVICFTIDQIENIFSLYMECVNDFSK